MAAKAKRDEIFVEGNDDSVTIRALLMRRGMTTPTGEWPVEYPHFRLAGSDDKVLAAMTTAIPLATGRSVGFVLDANGSLESRWSAVANKLRILGMSAPQKPASQGFVAGCREYESVVGVWIMPDNRRNGSIETFLRDLVEENDSIISHAEEATRRALEIGATFSSMVLLKAKLHAWLAWQKEPGLPYGTAMRAKYFLHEGVAADNFVDWFKLLFNLP